MSCAAKLDREPVMSALAGSEHHVFKSISLTSCAPIFLASISAEVEGVSIEMQHLFARPEDVADLLALADKDAYCVKQLQLISPPRLNGTKEWMIDPLIKVASGFHPSQGRIVTYELANGRQNYVDCLNGCRDGSIEHSNLESIFMFTPPNHERQGHKS